MRNRVCLLLALVWVSWPGHSCVAALLVEAENANIRTVGGAQGDVWNLWSNGEVGDYVHFEKEGPYSLAVRAYGSLCAGVWPLMGVAVDDEFVETRPVDSAVLKEYTFPIHVAPGVYKITAVFMNDHREGLEDRNLYLDVMEIRPGEGMPEAARGDEAAWKRAWRLRSAELEDRTLEAARAAIEQNRKTAATLLVVDERGAPAPQAQVSVKQVTHDFLFGCNIYKFDGYRSKAENDQYKQRFADLFNYATTGFYWKWYEQKQGEPQYGATDKVVAWCAAHDIRLKGHPLLWGNEAGRPGWTGGLPSPELQEKRVREIVDRYKGRIEFWEVVNEPAHVLNIAIDQPYRSQYRY
ncbi:MAG: endo-1,4-beta-xylanase [Candidatus Hydrogenedentes bacterium]|nr:endo-1,4-beta-xylanase [Candidatus Hydrogenedentota bacterium]